MSTMNVASSVFICLFIILNFFVSQRGYEAASIAKAKSKPITKSSILDEIKKDNDICPTATTIKESKYIKKCGDFDYPLPSVNVTEINIDELLCFGIYDRFVKMCHHDSIQDKNGISTALTDAEKFNSAIEKVLNDGPDFILDLCQSFQEPPPPIYNKTYNFVNQLEVTLKHAANCTKICHNESSNSLNILCIVLQFIDQQLAKTTVAIPVVPNNLPISKATKSDATATIKTANDAEIPPKDLKVAQKNSSTSQLDKLQSVSAETVKTSMRINTETAVPKKDTVKPEAAVGAAKKQEKIVVSKEDQEIGAGDGDSGDGGGAGSHNAGDKLKTDNINDKAQDSADTKYSTIAEEIHDDSDFDAVLNVPDTPLSGGM